MSKRLEAIKHDWVEKQKTYQFRPLTLEMNDVNWLIEQAERVEELETVLREVKNINVMGICDEDLLIHFSEIARQALEGEPK